MLLQLRLDERLVHGQVGVSWIRHLGATHLIVANDAVADDTFQKNLMKVGLPSETKCMIVSIDKAIELLNDPRSEPLKMFVIAQTPQDVLKLVDGVKSIKEVNIANYGLIVKEKVPNKTVINGFLSFDEEDIKCVMEIQSKVSNTYHQPVIDLPKKKLKLS